jgi:hypothetical protein
MNQTANSNQQTYRAPPWRRGPSKTAASTSTEVLSTHPAPKRTLLARMTDALAVNAICCMSALAWMWSKEKMCWVHPDGWLEATFKNMLPGQEAKCSCQRAALNAARSRQVNWVTTSADWVLSGCTQRGIPGFCKASDNVRKCVELGFSLSKEKFAKLTADFPQFHVLSGTHAHDHPLAHARTKFASAVLVDSLPKHLSRVVDLFGNPQSNEWTRHRTEGTRIDTLVSLVTPKDYIRSVEKWGDLVNRDYVQSGQLRDYMNEPFIQDADGLLSIHTLYYLTKKEIATVLAGKRKMLYALVHRFKGLEGSLNEGEQTWKKKRVGDFYFVTQKNVVTGEAYSHPDIEWIFEQGSWAHSTGSEHGMGWTTQLICEDTFLVKFTACPASICEVDFHPVLGEKVLPFDTFEEDLVNGIVTVKLGNTRETYTDIDSLAFKEMRAVVSGKARTPEQLKDHLAGTKRAMKKKETLTSHSVGCTALASFFIDVDKDLRLISAMNMASEEQRHELSSALSGYVMFSQRDIVNRTLQMVATAASFAPGGSAVSNLVLKGRDVYAQPHK